MTNAFAEFGFEPRPWMDPGGIQARYHELAVSRHPDKCGGDPAPLARLNEARKILSSHSARLRHLLALRGTPDNSASLFAPDFDLFARIGFLTRSAAEFSARRDQAASGLAAAVLHAEAASLAEKITAAQADIDFRLNRLEEQIRAADEAWPEWDPERILALADETAFVEKWRQQLRAARTLLNGG